MVQLWFSKHSGVSGKVYLSDRLGGLHLVQLRCRLYGSVAWKVSFGLAVVPNQLVQIGVPR